MSGATEIQYSNSRTGLVRETLQDFREDCISREKPMIFKSSALDTEKLEQCRQKIKEQIEEGVVLLPYYIDLISPQDPKIGHWIKWRVGYGCSECTLATNDYGKNMYRYCPNCGAKMEGNT